MARNQPPGTQTSDVSLSPEMARFSDFLDAVYRNVTPFQGSRSGQALSTTYTNLAVIKKERVSPADADEFTRATLHGGIDEIMNRKEAIELKDIFVPEEQQGEINLVLVEGAPGVGKSTLAWELCRRRHEVEAMRKFIAVVHLSLREKEVQDATSVADLLYHDDPDTVQAVAREFRSSGGENLLLVLDGFDEVPAHLRNSFFLAQVIGGTQLPKATVLVTSRPSARADLLSIRSPHKHIEVLGFTEDLIKQYASSAFSSDPFLVADFLTYIFTNASIKSMMYIPLNSAIVAEIYQENRRVGKPIPQTMTQLYTEITLTRMARYLTANNNQSVQLPENLNNLKGEHPNVHKQLLALAKLAFEGTLKQEVIFDTLPGGCSTLGLMTTSQMLVARRNVSARHNFFHLTMQEFLSAFHVSQLPGREQVKVFEQSSDKDKFSHMDVVWKFVAGLTGFEQIGWKRVQSTRGSGSEGEIHPFLVQCLYEAHEKAICESVFGKSKTISFAWSCSAFDCFALGYCIAVSRCTCEVSFHASHLGSELVEMLACGLRSQENACGSIAVLDLSGNRIGWEGVTHLGKMPIMVLQQLSHLDVHDCELDTMALDLLSNILPNMKSLKHLDVSAELERDGGTETLFQTLAATRHLHTLKLEYIPKGRDDIASLAQVVRRNGTLKELWVGHDNMEVDCMRLLVETVLSPSSLTHLSLCQINWTLVSLAPLRHNHNIVTLQLLNDQDNTIGSEAISTIANVLHTNTILEKVSIMAVPDRWSKSAYCIYVSSDISAALESLSGALKVNRSLKALVLGLYCVGEGQREAVRGLVGALWYNWTLRHVCIGQSWRQDFSSWEWMTMDRRVHFVVRDSRFAFASIGPPNYVDLIAHGSKGYLVWE